MQRGSLNTIPQRVHYGSRTHKNVKEGKNIRVDADGFENFSDYFSSPAVSECSKVSVASSRRSSVRLLTRHLVNGPGSAKSLQESYHEHIDSMSSFTPQSAALDLNSFSQEKNSAQLSEEQESRLYPVINSLTPDILMHANSVASADATAGAAHYPGLNLNGDRRGTICAPIVQTADAKQISPGLAIQTRKRLSYAVDSGSGSEQSKSSAIETSPTVSGGEVDFEIVYSISGVSKRVETKKCCIKKKSPTKVTTASKVKRNARVNYDEDLEKDTEQEDESQNDGASEQVLETNNNYITETSKTTTPLPRYSTASLLHYFDTTHTNKGTIEKKTNKSSQENRIILPSNTPGVRRSCRTRVRPLDWFRNERIKYDQHKTLWTVIGIESPPQPETKPKVGKVEKLVRKIIRKDKKLVEKEAKRKKNKLHLRRQSSFHLHCKPSGSGSSSENPNISFCSQPAFLPSHPALNTLPSSPAPVFLASHLTSDTVPSSPAHSTASNSVLSKQERAKTGIVVINPLTGKEEIIDCVKSKSSYQLFGSSGKEATADDPFIICKPIRLKNFASGLVTLRGFQQKNPSFVQNDVMAFTVMRGELEVTIHRTKCLVEADDCFFVPPGNTYSIRNLRSEVACLSYTQVKGSHGQPSLIKE